MKNIFFSIFFILIIIANIKIEWVLPFIKDESIKIFIRISLLFLNLIFSVMGLISTFFPDYRGIQRKLRQIFIWGFLILFFVINTKVSWLYYGFYKIDNDLKYLEKAVNTEPGNSLYNRELGRYYSDNHEYEKAIFYYKIALKNKDEKDNHLLHYDIGCAYLDLFERGKIDKYLNKAIEYLFEANKKKTDSHEYNIALGKAYFLKSPNEDDILNYLASKTEKLKENADYYYLRGYIHMNREELELAKADFEKAIKKEPTSIENYFEALKVLYGKAIVKVRRKGTKEWNDYIEVKVGDEIEYSLEYKNQTADEVTSAKDIMLLCFFPENVEYVKGTTILYNTSFIEGVELSDDIVRKGINIGDYSCNSNGIIKLKGKVVDKTLVKGLNRVRMWGRVGIGKGIKQDYADIFVRK